MKSLTLFVAVVLVGCVSGPEETPSKATTEKPQPPKVVPNSYEAVAAIETEIRKAAEKPTGELTKTDLEKVTHLNLYGNQLTDVKGLEKLTQLTRLHLGNNRALPKAQITELQKALPKCKIYSNATKQPLTISLLRNQLSTPP